MGQPEPITAAVSPWFYRRMIIMTLVCLGMGAFFLYDGLVRYPEKGRIYQAHQTWETYSAEREEFLRTELDDANWVAEAREDPRYQPFAFWDHESWKAFANSRGWPEKPPEKDYGKKVMEQFVCAGICFVLVGALAIFTLLNRGRVLSADGESFTTPGGERVPFTRAVKIDKRKWDNKGLAYVFYDDESGRRRRAVIDCLKFGKGAETIFDRLLEHFEGELVELVRPEEEAAVAEGDSPRTLPAGEARQDPS